MIITIYLLSAYLIGNIMFGYIIAKLIGKVDLRTAGSGNVGARNIGRVVGKGAFVATFIGDASKAALIILLGKKIGLPLAIQLLAFFLVIIAHIWPITLRFQGGKGVASFLGGLLIIEPTIFLFLIGSFLLSMLILRDFTKAGLLSIALTPFIPLFYDYQLLEIGIFILTTVLILYIHRFTRVKE
jgi:acyl phosphate:glycerol-3-phosphate acyltransferase